MSSLRSGAGGPTGRRTSLLSGAINSSSGTGSVATHEHVGRHAAKRESLTQSPDGEVHAAVLAAAQIRQWRRVDGDDGDRTRALAHGLKCTHPTP